MTRGKLLILIPAVAILGSGIGCSLIVPTVAHQPVIRNPFPQLHTIAVAPFFNLSDEPTLDGRKAALAYFAELQSTPGFEVVPLGVVEEAILAHHVDLNGPGEARRLAQILGVDAIAVGAVTDFSEYYPPRVGLRVEWYTANPGFHEIPAGYGLPWGTPEEEFIPDSLVYESQLALARAEMAALSPDCFGEAQPLPSPGGGAGDGQLGDEAEEFEESPEGRASPAARRGGKRQFLAAVDQSTGVIGAAATIPATSSAIAGGAATAVAPMGEMGARNEVCAPCNGAPGGLPPCVPHNGPVLSHTRLYHGADADVVEALEGYVFFRDDDRFGGWRSYLYRSDDYLRFCCRMHISEMLSARGGSRKTQVVWRWPESR